MKTVAIYGFAPQTRHFVSQSKADEIWSLNNCYAYGLPIERIGRTFEMHELWFSRIARDRSDSGVEYWNWLLAPHDFPIYMHLVGSDFEKALADLDAIDMGALMAETASLEDEKEAAKKQRLIDWIAEQKKIARMSIDFFNETKATILKYPLDEVWDDIAPVLPGINLEVFPERGMKKYFTSSMDYMIALAIHEKFEQIEFYGIELKEKTEWAMQKPSMEYWVGVAKGRGIRMLIPEISYLINAPLYGLGSAQMIAVQVPEALRRKYIEKMDYWRNIFNHQAGQYTAWTEMHTRLKDKQPTAVDIAEIPSWLHSLELVKEPEADEVAKDPYIDKFDVVKIAESITGWQEKTKDEMLENILKETAELGPKLEMAKSRIFLYEGAANAMTHMIDHENMDINGIEIETVTQFEVVSH